MQLLHDGSAETRHVLQRLSMESQHHRVRQRAHCLLLSCQGFNTTALRAIFSVHRLTIYHWVDAWEAHHFAGLYDHKRCGRPPKLTAEEQDQAQHYLTQHPSDISKVVHLVEQATSRRVSTKTIKRLVKKPLCLETHHKNSGEVEAPRHGRDGCGHGQRRCWGRAGPLGSRQERVAEAHQGSARGRGVRVLLGCSTMAPRGSTSEAASYPWSRRGKRHHRTWREAHGRRR